MLLILVYMVILKIDKPNNINSKHSMPKWITNNYYRSQTNAKPNRTVMQNVEENVQWL